MTYTQGARDRNARWYAAHHEEILAGMRDGRRANIDRVRQQEKARHDRRRCGGNWLPALERDDHRCVDCGTTEGLVVHHLDGRSKCSIRNGQPNHSLDNLVTLCASCHTRRHDHDPSLPIAERHERKVHGIAAMTPEQLSASRKKTAESIGAEGRSARVRKAWANMTPDKRAEWAAKLAEASRAAKAEKSRKMREHWASLSPEDRAARVQRVADGTRKSRPAAAAKLRQRLSELSPEERHQRGVRLAAARWGKQAGSHLEVLR
jgi:hypothetical protein